MLYTSLPEIRIRVPKLHDMNGGSSDALPVWGLLGCLLQLDGQVTQFVESLSSITKYLPYLPMENSNFRTLYTYINNKQKKHQQTYNKELCSHSTQGTS